VVGGLWPAELSTITDENATLAEHLRDDLQRITSRTNDELKLISEPEWMMRPGKRRVQSH